MGGFLETKFLLEKMSKILIFIHFLLPAFIFCDVYHENLDIIHLPNNDLAAKLRFTTLKPIDGGSDWSAHYELFPKTIGDLVQKYNVQEFHLSLTQGFWRIRQWGFPVHTGVPTGAQIWSWFSSEEKNVDETWRNFIHALSGLFCASFSQIDEKLTVSPEFAYRPEGAFNSNNLDNKFVRYGVLPSENVCTENLTPWKKLLPCKSGGGIGRLLNALKLYNANYHSLNVDFRRVCSDEKCKTVSLELTQTIVVVFDRSSGKGWSLTNLFGTYIEKSCHLATTSSITLQIPSRFNPKFTPAINNSDFVDGKFISAKFDVFQLLKMQNYVNVLVEYSKKPSSVDSVHPPPVSLHSYTAGTGQYSGVLTSRIENSDEKSKKILYSHVVPWFLRVYYHTLTVTCNEHSTKPDFVVYQPARDRQRPHYIEIALELPPKSACKIAIQYEKLLLRWTEYPPDANHGFYVPGPSISFFHQMETSSSRLTNAFDNPDKLNFIRLSGEVLLINLPTPDFSMPYNVICLVCTVVALAFGPIHNLTTRRLVVKDPDEIKKKSLKTKVQNFIIKIKSKFGAKSRENEAIIEPKND